MTKFVKTNLSLYDYLLLAKYAANKKFTSVHEYNFEMTLKEL